MKLALVLFCTASAAVAAETSQPKPRPEFQYKSGDIEVAAAKSDEPRVTAFGAATVRAAAQYLEKGALCWVREKSCVNCHTTGPYMAEWPALSTWLGRPNEEIRDDFVKSIPDKGAGESERDGVKFYPGANTAVWRSVGLAEWDKHVTGSLSEDTQRSLRTMFDRQSANGGFVSIGEVEIPHITTDFELTLQAARAITSAPGWLANLKDVELQARVEKMKAFLRDVEPRNDFDRVLRLQLAHYLPDLVSSEQKEAALALLSRNQHADGGWSLRDMSALLDWHYKISDTVAKLIASLPDAAKPESDPYMTALAVVLMRQSGVPVEDERIQRGIAWLKKEQRVSGRWWMDSLYRGNYNYITYIATCQALKALALCGELDR